MTFVGLAIEPYPGPPEHPVLGRHAVVGKPLHPPIVAGVDQMLAGKVAWFELASKLRFDLGNAFRARHRREARLEQLVMLEPFPVAAAGADRDVGLTGAQ